MDATGLNNQPRTLVVFDISSNFASDGRVSIEVQKVVLNLEKLAKWNGNSFDIILQLDARVSTKSRGDSDRQVYGIVASFERDYGHIAFFGELVKIGFADRGSCQIHSLAQGRFVDRVLQKFNDFSVPRQRRALKFHQSETMMTIFT